MPKSLPDYLGDEVINGRLTSVFSDGTLLPVVRGGADDSGAGDGSGGDGGSGDGSGGTDGGQGGEGDAGGDLGDGGKKALDSERTARRDAEKARKTAEARAKELEDRLAKFEEGSKSEHEKALEKATKEAADGARKEATAAANARVVRAEVKAAAGGKLADPNDAIRLLDLDEFEVDDDGNVDPKKVSSAIDDLIKSKPYLAANGGKRFQGGADGGGRDESGGGDKIAPGSDRLRHAYANSSKK